MSTLAATTLQDRASLKTHPVLSTLNGVPKVWGCYNYSAGVPSIQTSLNVSSVGDLAVGRLDVNHTAPVSAGVYSGQVSTWASTNWVKSNGVSASGASQHTLYMTEGTGGALTDPGSCNSLICGSLP